MATCRDCNQEMRKQIPCIKTRIRIGEVEYDRIPYRNDQHPEPHFCHDCSSPVGGMHHLGCDMEQCPKCGRQLISCGCLDNVDYAAI